MGIRRRTPTTDEARETQLISDAMDLAAKQIRDGTASSQVLTHFLKSGSGREKLERERLVSENKLLQAKVEALQRAANIEDLYANAIRAMGRYQGKDPDHDQEYYDE